MPMDIRKVKMPKVGDTVTRTLNFEKAFNVTLTGTVIFVNAPHLYYIAEFETNGSKIRYSFKCPELSEYPDFPNRVTKVKRDRYYIYDRTDDKLRGLMETAKFFGISCTTVTKRMKMGMPINGHILEKVFSY